MSGDMEPKWLYRLESTDPEKGLWYDANGELVWTIGLIPDCETKNLPWTTTSGTDRTGECGIARARTRKT